MSADLTMMRALQADREKLIALGADPGPQMMTCENCGGEGGFETVEMPTDKWGDPTPGGRWIECIECVGSGWVIGDLPSIDIDDLPRPPSHGETP